MAFKQNEIDVFGLIPGGSRPIGTPLVRLNRKLLKRAQVAFSI